MSEFTVNQEEAFFPVSPDWEAAVSATFGVRAFAGSVLDAMKGLEDGPALSVLIDGRHMLSTIADEMEGQKKVLSEFVKAIMERNPAWKIGFVTEHGAKVQWTEGSKPGANAAARRMDSTRLASRAMPWPAMSNAVPWSTETRTTGRPTVMFTPSSP